MKKNLILLYLVVLFLNNINVLAVDINNHYINTMVTTVFDNDDTITSEIKNKKYGSKLSFAQNLPSIINDYSFAYYLLNNRLQGDLTFQHQFVLTENMDIKALFSRKDKVAAIFIDTNSMVLDIQFIDKGHNASEPTINLPSKPGYEINANKWDKSLLSLQSHTVFILQYTKVNNSEFELVVNNGQGSGLYGYNEVATIACSDPNFAYWMEGDHIVSYEPVYKFTMLANKTITAISGVTKDIKPIVNLSNDLHLKDGFKSYLGQISYPSNYELIEYGMITCSYKIDNITLNHIDSIKHQGYKYLPLTKEWIMSFLSNKVAIIRGYMILKDNDGNLFEFYSHQIDNTAKALTIDFGNANVSNYSLSYLNFTNTSNNTQYNFNSKRAQIYKQFSSHQLHLGPYNYTNCETSYVELDFSKMSLNNVVKMEFSFRPITIDTAYNKIINPETGANFHVERFNPLTNNYEIILSENKVNNLVSIINNGIGQVGYNLDTSDKIRLVYSVNKGVSSSGEAAILVDDIHIYVVN